jgi:hypothetical protein
MRSMTLAMILALVVAGGGSCSSSSSGSDGGTQGSDSGNPGSDAGSTTSGTFSCDISTSGVHLTCFETGWSGGSFSTSTLASQCTTTLHGTVGTGCSRTGAVGGCRGSEGTDPVVTTTEWYYSGTAADLKSACEGSGGTWVNP